MHHPLITKTSVANTRESSLHGLFQLSRRAARTQPTSRKMKPPPTSQRRSGIIMSPDTGTRSISRAMNYGNGVELGPISQPPVLRAAPQGTLASPPLSHHIWETNA